MAKWENRAKYSAQGLVFTGCMFVGGGLGNLFGHSNPGWLIGMGVGFIGIALIRLLSR